MPSPQVMRKIMFVARNSGYQIKFGDGFSVSCQDRVIEFLCSFQWVPTSFLCERPAVNFMVYSARNQVE